MPPEEWALGLLVFGSAAWALAVLLPARTIAGLERGIVALAAGRSRRRTALSLGLLAALLCLASALAYEYRPQSVDSVALLFQAKIFASGDLFGQTPRFEEFFVIPHMVAVDGKWFSQYPPGHAALLALGVLAGAPWLVPVLLSLAAAGLLYGFAARAYDRTTANVTLLLLLISPFFWMMGARMMNHVSSLAGLALLLYAWARAEESGSRGSRWMLLAGAGLGMSFLSRPLEALAVGGVAAGFLIAAAARGGRWRCWLAFGAGFAALAGLYLAFNALTTGDPLRPGYIELWGSSHGLGFHATPWGDHHTPLAGVRNELVDLALLDLYLFEWPVPALLPLGLALVAGWLTRRWDDRLLAMFLAIPFVYFFYWHRDASMGPRFLYAGVAFVVPLVARALTEAARRLAGNRVPLPGSPRASLASFALLLGILVGLYGIGYGAPARFRVFETGMESMKLDVAVAAREAGIERGVVFVAVSWGDRLIARLHGLGASASLAEKAYRQADHCELDGLVRRAVAERWSGRRVEEGLQTIMIGEERLVHADVNGDPSARFRPGSRLTPECLDEIRYDQAGYTIYAPHLPENDPALRGPLVTARDLREHNGALRILHDLPGWLYQGGSFVPIVDAAGSEGS